MRILGIDPGTSRIGFGIIETAGTLRLIDYGVIEAKEKTLTGKIANFSKKFEKLLNDTNPELAAIETLFFAKNQKTALSVAQARGVLMSYLISKNIPIEEYGPTEVKVNITGYGLSDKQAVAKMVKSILKVSELKGYDDAVDAIAVAITAASHQKLRKGLTPKQTDI
ncbi:MAG: crossover junction endodeoxyribonuclease RuvC [bacterium]|nr:crossover junction endodeoxyribonuclease RuvC [bacterium]